VQLFQISLQSRAQSTQLLSIFFCLHLFTINCIQIYKSQEKKIDTSKKMFQLCQGNSMLAGVQTTPSAVSESQVIKGRLSSCRICGEEGLQELPWMDALSSGGLHQAGKDAVGFESGL
jgi:hypothetical protein